MHSIIRSLVAASALCVGIGCASALAQTGSTTTSPQPDNSNHATSVEKNPPVIPVPRGQVEHSPETANDSLSNLLNRSGGVIHPPATADKSVLPPPNQAESKTPVLPPPGTPGGNPQVQPK